MLSEKMFEELNKQINAELYSSYLYLSMSAYFEDNDLPGFANWMRVQAQEELDHGMKIFDYIVRRGAKVTLEQIDKPDITWKDELDVVENVLKHEQYVTSLISNLIDVSIDEKDHPTNNFLQWFIAEQVEEEENASELVSQVKRTKSSKSSLYILDSELATRVYTPISEEE